MESAWVLALKLAVIVIPVLLERLLAREPKENAYEKNMRAFDAALAGRDGAAMGVLFSVLRIPERPPDPAGDCNPGGQNDRADG
jgi:hypothetical protein